MNIENINERLLRTERERDEARAEVERISESNEDSAAMVERLGAELARLRVAANERAIAELEWALREESLDYVSLLRDRVATLRAEQQAAPACSECDDTKTVEKVDWPGEHANRYQEPCPKCAAPVPPPVTPPADAPSRPSVARLEELREIIRADHRDGASYRQSITHLQYLAALLIDDALAGRGGAK